VKRKKATSAAVAPARPFARLGPDAAGLRHAINTTFAWIEQIVGACPEVTTGLNLVWGAKGFGFTLDATAYISTLDAPVADARAGLLAKVLALMPAGSKLEWRDSTSVAYVVGRLDGDGWEATLRVSDTVDGMQRAIQLMPDAAKRPARAQAPKGGGS